MGKLQAKFEQMPLTGIPQSKSGPIMDVHGRELALQGDERDLNGPKPGHTSDLSDFPQVCLPVHIANYSMQRSQGTQMLPPGQKQQSQRAARALRYTGTERSDRHLGVPLPSVAP